MKRDRKDHRLPDRRRVPVGLLLALALVAGVASAADGLITMRSPYSERETMDRFVTVARNAGMNIFARIDHTAGAQQVGRSLRPTEVLIFGNPKGGTPLLECSQTAGIDLPMKLLVWTDESDQVWIGYNDPAWIGRRHGVESCPAISTLSQALAKMVEGAIASGEKR
jgi:uncharacterized protein (DUF302 family)